MPAYSALAVGALAGVGGMHYYNQWPLRSMIILRQKYRLYPKIKLTLADIIPIKDNENFWYNVLSAMTPRQYLPNEPILTTLNHLLDQNTSARIIDLLDKAIERLELMHGVWKYGPGGWYRKVRESTG